MSRSAVRTRPVGRSKKRKEVDALTAIDRSISYSEKRNEVGNESRETYTALLPTGKSFAESDSELLGLETRRSPKTS